MFTERFVALRGILSRLSSMTGGPLSETVVLISVCMRLRNALHHYARLVERLKNSRFANGCYDLLNKQDRCLIVLTLLERKLADLEKHERSADVDLVVRGVQGLWLGYARHESCRVLAVVLLACSILSALFAVLIFGNLLAGVFVLACWVWWWYALPISFAKREQERIDTEMIEVFRIFGASYAVGFTTIQAFERVAQTVSSPLKECFAEAAFELAIGESYERVLRRMRAKITGDAMSLYLAIIQISQLTGASLGHMISQAQAQIRAQHKARQSFEGKTAQALLSAKIVGLLPTVLMSVLVSISPDYRAGVFTLTGMASIMISLALSACGAWSIKQIMNRALAQVSVETQQVSQCMDLLALALSSGMSFYSACQVYAQHFSHQFAHELIRAQFLVIHGFASFQQAFDRIAQAESAGSSQWIYRFSRAVLDSQELGVGLADLLHQEAEQMREEQIHIVTLKMEKAPIKMLIPTATLMLPALLIALLGPFISSLMSSSA